MKATKGTGSQDNLIGDIEIARVRLAEAQVQCKAAKEQARLAKRRRKEARQAARQARKQARLAKAGFAEAKQALAKAEKKLARAQKRAAKAKKEAPTKATRRRRKRHSGQPKQQVKPMETVEPAVASVAQGIPTPQEAGAVSPVAPVPETPGSSQA
jgi:hypothetical protein